MVSYADMLRNGTQNVGGATTNPAPPVTVNAGTPPPAAPQAPSSSGGFNIQDYAQYAKPGADGQMTWTGPQYVFDGSRMRRGTDIMQDLKRNMLYSEYTDPTTGKAAFSGPTRQYGDPSGVNVRGGRATPETHPWLFPEGQKDPMAGKDYGAATFNTNKPGFPDIPGMSWADSQKQAQSQNWFQNGNQGLDPRLMQGMTRQGPGNTFGNQFGTYQTSRIGMNPQTGQAQFFGSQFNGVDQEGNAVSHQGRVPYGAKFQEAVQNIASRMARNGGPSGGVGGSRPPGGSPTPGQVPGNGGLPGNGTLPGQFIGLPGGLPPWLQNAMGQGRQAPDWWNNIRNQAQGGMQTAASPWNPNAGGMTYTMPQQQATANALRGATLMPNGG